MLKRLRREKGLTQKQLAKKVGVNNSYICRFENKKIDCVSTNFIINLAEVLEVEPVIIFEFVLQVKRQ